MVAICANDELQKAVDSAVSRVNAADAANHVGFRKKLSSKLIKEYSSKLKVGDATSQSDAERRRLTVLRIGQSQDCRLLELIEPLRNDAWKMVRQAVAMAFGELANSRSVALSMELLCDREGDVIRESIRSLKKLADVRSTRPLMVLGLTEPSLRVQTLDAVVSFGSSGISELLEIINERNPLTIEDAVIALGRIGDTRAVPALLLTLDHADDRFRPKILDALGLLGDRSALSAIVGQLSDNDEKVQLSAVRAVQRIPDLRAVKPIVKILHETQNAELRLQSVIALATSGSQKAVAILSALLPRADAVLQKAIAAALCHINSCEASEVLVRLLEVDDLTVVVKALSGLRRNSVPAAIPKLIQLSQHRDEQIRRHAVDALVATSDERVFRILEQRLLNESSSGVRAVAARGFGKLANKQATRILEQALNDESAVRCAAISSLASLGDTSAIPALLASLKDAVPEVRYHAVAGLGKLRADTAVRAVRAMLNDDSEIVRVGARTALEELGGKNVPTPGSRKIVKLASSLMPDRLAGVLPAGPVLAALTLVIAVVIFGWISVSSSTASMSDVLAVVRAKAVTKALWIPDSTDVILLRADGPADIWNAATGQFKNKVEVPELELLRHPTMLFSREGESLNPWTPDGTPVTSRAIKLPAANEFNLAMNGAFAIYVDDTAQVAIWDTTEGASTGNLMLRTSPVPVISADGSLVAGADTEGNIVVLDRVTGEQIGHAGEAGSVVSRDGGVFGQMLFCSETNLLAVLRSDRIVLVSVSEDGLESRIVDATVHSKCVQFLNPSLIYAASGTFVRRVDLTTGETQSWEVSFDQVEINSLSLSADETFAVASAEDGKTGWVLNLTDGSTQELSPADWPAE